MVVFTLLKCLNGFALPTNFVRSGNTISACINIAVITVSINDPNFITIFPKSSCSATTFTIKPNIPKGASLIISIVIFINNSKKALKKSVIIILFLFSIFVI